MKLLISNKNYINLYLKNLNYKIIFNKYGKPIIKNKKIFFNKSHTNKFSVLVIDNKLCGIDIENIKEYNDLISKKICSKEEYEYLNNIQNKNYYFTLLWVLKESYIKCLGLGLSYKMNKISFIKNNKIITKINGYNFTIIKYKNNIISICRKD